MSGRRETRGATSSLARFSRTSEQAAHRVIRSYSTSFGVATRLLGRRHRHHVRNVYALVRVADEIVDGVASQAGLDRAQQLEALDQYESQTYHAIERGYSSDLIIHAFAQTARASDIDDALISPFFASMRTDLLAAGTHQVVLDDHEHETYVYGSAQVVGLMCVRIFMRNCTVDEHSQNLIDHGARQLGAAFQNVNFLRDLADDTQRLGRNYLGNHATLSDAEVHAWVRKIRTQLIDADAAIPLLPHDARAAVRSAHALFSNLTDRLAQTPAHDLYRVRIRVPDTVKAALASAAVWTTWKEGRA